MNSHIPLEMSTVQTAYRPASSGWYSSPVAEEFPMTMQVAMVGTDGIVLASDTKWAYTAHGSDNNSVRHTQMGSKIKINRDRNVAISFARNMETSGEIADAIISGLTDADWEWPVMPIETVAQRVVDTKPRKDAQCIIASSRSGFRLFQCDVALVNGEPDRAICREISDRAIVGDNSNAAVFWSERYWARKPIRQLIPLAAHLIISAGELNSGAIGGLEIVVCDSGGLRHLSTESIATLNTTT